MLIKVIRERPDTGAGGGGGLYWWDGRTPDSYTLPSRALNDPGSGSVGSPYNMDQARQLETFGGAVHLNRLLPGRHGETYADSENPKYPAWCPDNSGASAAGPLIFQAQDTSSTASFENRTYIERDSSAGSILGFKNVSHCIIDGPWCHTTTTPTTGETALCAVWGSTECKAVRLNLDAENDTYGGGNFSIVYAENTEDCEIADVVAKNIGVRATTNPFGNVAAYIGYDNIGLSLHHWSVEECSAGWWEKGQLFDKPNGVSRNRYYRSHFYKCGIAAYSSSPMQSTTNGASWFYDLIAENCHFGFGFKTFADLDGPEPFGIIFQNVIVVNPELWDSSFGADTIGFLIAQPSLSGSYSLTPLIVRGAIVKGANFAWQTLDSNWSGTDHAGFDLDRSIYHAMSSNILSDGGTGRDMTYWQNTIGQDDNSLTSDPLFTNYAGRIYTLQGGSPAIGLSRDYLNAYGGGANAVVNAGINWAASSAMGHRN